MSKGNEEFKKYTLNRLNKLFDEVLYNVEMAVRSDYQYGILRKRILRSGNNALRDVVEEIDYYLMEEDKSRTRKMDNLIVERDEDNERG